MTHIALYLPNLRGGGAERVLVLLANGFAARGHRIDLVLARAEGTYLSEVADTVRIVDLRRRRVLSSLSPLVRYLRRNRPSAILSAMNHANIVAILASKLARVPIRLVISERSAPSQHLAGGGTVRVLRFLTRLLYPLADCVICVAHGVQDEMEQILQLPPAKLCTIYNPVDIEGIDRLKSVPPGHAWLAPDQRPVILAVGRLTKAKDYPTLLRAFAQLQRRLPTRLIILGEGPDGSTLREMASTLGLREAVDFVGFNKNPFAFMAACDLYVMSSAFEGLPSTLLQAMACGAKVVSTDCRTGPGEILEDGRWGRLVPVGDAEALAHAMEAALSDPTPPDVRRRALDFHHEYITDLYLQALAIND